MLYPVISGCRYLVGETGCHYCEAVLRHIFQHIHIGNEQTW
jgi:hypothetical protein